MRNRWILFLAGIILIFSASCSDNALNDYTKYVDTMIGTGVYSSDGAMGESNTFPGPALPHGMVQLSPDTGPHIAGYLNTDTTIQGFSHTHLSGTGCWGLGNFLVMPTNGKIETEESGYRSAFSKKTEKAIPGYYSVKLEDYGILAELTATKRAGLHRYNFPANEKSNIIFDITHNLADDDPEFAEVEIINSNRIQGSVTIPEPFCGGEDAYTIYFAALVSKPFAEFGTWSESGLKQGNRITSGQDIGCFISYNLEQSEEIFLKVGVSFVSSEQALLNVKTEIPGWKFSQIRKQAKRAWNQKLNTIQVQGGTREDKIKFYTSLYHALLGPYTASDVNGKYRGMDKKVHTAKDHTYYHVYSLWDTFRSQHPLLTLIEPEIQNELVMTLLDKQKQGGWLPKWEFANHYTNCMIADHATSVIAESYIKGIRDYDTEHAYQAMRRNSTRLPGKGDITVLSKGTDFIPLKLCRKDGKAKIIWKNNGETNSIDFDWKYLYNDFQWHHYALKYDQNNNLQVYLDGKKVAQTSEKIPSLQKEKGSWKLGVHRENDKSGLYFTGNVGKIAFYDKPLDKKEILSLAKGNNIPEGIRIDFSKNRESSDYITIHGEPEFEKDKFSTSLAYDGIDDLLEIKNDKVNNKKFTLSFWFKTSAPTDFEGRNGLDYYIRYGYIPHNTEWGGWGSVSTTLEDAYNDYSIAKVAQAMGKTEDYKMFIKRAGFYKNLFDASTGFMRPKNKDGSWKQPFNPGDWEGFTEGNSWSYTWFVPHDVKGLMNLMGREKFIEKLDHIFSDHAYPKWDQYFSHYWHGNEPSQQLPYYYNYARQPWKTQEIVDDIMYNLYGIGSTGIPGNEDVGQLSAWFVLSAMGFHPVAPSQGTYLIGRPLFDRIEINLNKKYYNSDKFIIEAENNSRENKYIQSLSINGKKTDKTWFKHELIKKGGKISFDLGSEINKNFGTSDGSIPPSMSDNRK